MKNADLVLPGERLDDLCLDGLMIIQNPKLYLFTSDAVELANFAKCKKGDKVVELCSGSGVIGILMQHKCAPSQMHLVELQQNLADMSARSILYNGLDNIYVHNCRLQGVSDSLGKHQYDEVIVNPPYKSTNNKVGAHTHINIAKHEIEVTLEEIIKEAGDLLKFGGKLYMVNKIERLADIIVYMRTYKIEPKEIKFLPGSVLISGTYGGKSGLKLIK